MQRGPVTTATASAAAWRRGLVPGWAERFLLALAASAAAALVALPFDPSPGHLRPQAAVAFAAGALFGPAGIAAVVFGQCAVLLVAPGHPLAPLLVAGCADALIAAAAWLAFRFGRGAGRALPDLPSYFVAAAAAVVGSLVAAPLTAGATAAAFPHALGLQLVGNLTGVVLAGLPLMLCARVRFPERVVRLPHERGAPPARRLGDEAEATESIDLDDTEVTRMVPPPPAGAWHGIGVGAAIVGAITLAAAPLVATTPDGAYWAALLYLGAVIWGARAYGLRGGVVAASASGLALLGAAWLLGRLTGNGHVDDLSLYAQLVLLSPVGAYLGQAREREVRLRSEVISHSRLLRQDLLRVVRALTAAIEAKDSYTEAHLRRVGDYAVATGIRLGLRGRDLEMLYYAAMLHDVGKIGVPEPVLRKRGPLDDEEVAQMRRHPEIGARIVRGLDVLSEAAPLILYHQERWDGGDNEGYPGYPAGLRGEQIPLGARIIAVVDAYDAMTSHRPYRAALPLADAVAELQAEAGKQFDPAVVQAFVGVLREKPWLAD